MREKENHSPSSAPCLSDRERELNLQMSAVSYRIQSLRQELLIEESEFYSIWREKQLLERSRICVRRVGAAPRKRTLASVRLDELPQFLASLSPEEQAAALEEIFGLEEKEKK
jgi:DNA-binding Lrp family transcriptional regulator